MADTEGAQVDGTMSNLEPSKLGTRAYWDNYYENDIDNDETVDELPDLADLESWFDDVGAPAKIMDYLTGPFPLAEQRQSCSVLDLGTGNGSSLFSLRHEGGYEGLLVGIDYSEQSIRLANHLKTRFASTENEHHLINVSNVVFDVFDLVNQVPQKAIWWPETTSGFDLVLDKGTFDAISLSSELVTDSHGAQKRMNEVYPAKVVPMVRPGGYFLITSCNWTEEEIVNWFTGAEHVPGAFTVVDRIKYKTFSFGGQKGQGVATVCFQRSP